jgi:glycosyltransferase involved in cell wall biosynthesis
LPHGGPSVARNAGLEAAVGEFVMFLDADDVIGPDVLEALVSASRESPHAIAVCSWSRLVERDGQWTSAPAETPLPEPDADPLLGWLHGRWVPPCAVLWRRELYESIGGWDETLTMNDDGDLMMRALARGASLVVAHGGGALYRAHGTDRLSVSRNLFAERHLRSLLRVYVKLVLELEGLGRLEPYRERIGVLLLELALAAYQVGFPEVARECSARAEALVSKRAVSRTWLGRLLTWVLGMERKERMVDRLAHMGLMTAERRRFLVLRRRAGEQP